MMELDDMEIEGQLLRSRTELTIQVFHNIEGQHSSQNYCILPPDFIVSKSRSKKVDVFVHQQSLTYKHLRFQKIISVHRFSLT